MNYLIRRMFETRGYTSDYLSDINVSDHDTLLSIDTMCQTLHDIHDCQSVITVLPDFDMDGIMSGVTGFAGLAELGFNVRLYIPDPKAGYGFDESVIDDLLKQHPDTQTIITCDTGISCYEGITSACSRGLQVLITDHHIQTKVATDASVIVDPMRMDETYSHPGICGAYVFYQVLQHYADTYTSVLMQEQIRRLRVFAGIGTISDSMPLLYENRQLVLDSVSISRLIFSCGSRSIVDSIMGCDIYRRAFAGLYSVYDMLAQVGTISSDRDITEELYGFYIAPMFNSVKRMNGELSRAFGVFFGPTPDDDVQYLFTLNNHRKLSVQEYLREIAEQSQPYAPYVYLSSAPKGILGLLANSLMEQTGEPVLVINELEHFSGSGRSPAWYPFMSRAVNAGFYCAGHDVAFGVGFTDKREIQSFIAFIKKDVEDVRQTVDIQEIVPDFTISISDTTGDIGIDILMFAEYLSELERYRPFGNRFEAPYVKLTFRKQDAVAQLLGSDKRHLKFLLSYGFCAICWNAGQLKSEVFDKLNDTDEIVLYGHLAKNVFNGNVTIQFIGSWDVKECGI